MFRVIIQDMQPIKTILSTSFSTNVGKKQFVIEELLFGQM